VSVLGPTAHARALLALIGLSLAAAAAPARVHAQPLTLSEALRTARERQPQLRQARATKQAFRARSDRAHAPLYPQIEASATYQRTTSNCTPRPGQTPCLTADPPDFDNFNYFNLGLSARQLVYDFGQTYGRAQAAEAEHRAEAEDERATLADVEANVRMTFFAAWAAKALVGVARESVANYDQHVHQIEGFVRAGTRAEIDLAQARTERANARVDLIAAENTYSAAKARLNRAIGREGSTDFDVAEEGLPEVPGEDGGIEVLLRRALAQRSELRAIDARVRAQELTRSSAHGGHFPSLSVFLGATEVGVEPTDMAWNLNAGVALNWSLYEGGAVSAEVDEAAAQLIALRAELDGLRQQVRLEVEEARLAVRGAKGVTEATQEAIASAREQLRLAEGRYAAGVGSGLELSDAQVAMQAAAAQRVQAEYRLASARAQLLRALGQ
jgi:outer membrane protein